MKKLTLVLIAIVLIVFFASCHKKAPPPKVEPPKPAPAPVVVQPPPAPVVEKPVLTEEDIFNQKTLEDLNKENNLKRINFDFDKYFIREDMKPTLQANADYILKHKTVEIRIEGHCDERGTVEYNIALGEKRAESAKTYLSSLGVAAEKIKVISYGKSRPLVQGKDEASYFQNRRDEFVIIKK